MKKISINDVIAKYDIYESRAIILPSSPLATRVPFISCMFKYSKIKGVQIAVDDRVINIKPEEYESLEVTDRDFLARARRIMNHPDF